MDKINKLSLPTTILIGCFILGGFYYASQVTKQQSIERQQQAELNAKAKAEQEKSDSEALDRLARMNCVTEAQNAAVDLNKESCKRGDYCIEGEGMYLTGQYDNAYNTCLQRKGLK